MYTDEFIDSLIKCPKKIMDAPKLLTNERNSSSKKTFTLSSEDEKQNFNCFITQNTFFKENFSIGLVHNPKEEKGTVVLVRYNGLHGGTKIIPHHAYCHIHKATAERINEGLKPEGLITETKEYSTLEEAIQFFVKSIGLNIADREKYFPPMSNQINLFEE